MNEVLQAQAIPAPPVDETKLPLDAALEQAPKDAEKPPEKEDKFSSKFAALARREKQLLAREAEIKTKSEKLKSFDDEEKAFHADPFDYLKKKFNADYNYLTQRVLNNNQLTEAQKVEMVEKRLEKFVSDQQAEKERAKQELEQTQKQKQNAEYQATIETFVSNIDKAIKADPDNFEFLNAQEEAPQMVYNVIEEHFSKTGKVLETAQAIEYVEKYLESESEKYLNLKKIKSKFEQPKDAQGKFVPQTPKPSAPKTLTNSHQTEVPAPQQKALTPEESKRIAAKMLRWT